MKYTKLVKQYITENSWCELCGRKEHLTIHHIIARTKSGKDDRWNLAILCVKCHDKIEAFNFNSVSEYKFYIKYNFTNTNIKFTFDPLKPQVNKKHNLLNKKARLKLNFKTFCRCGCEQEFMTNRKNKIYKNKGHKMVAWKKNNQIIKTEIGDYQIIIKGETYRITENPGQLIN